MKKKLSLLLVIIWMVFIFIMSSFSASNSNDQSSFIVTIIGHILNITNLESLNYIIRKLAHITEYLILGMLSINMIKNYHKPNYYAIIICSIYAISDEIHQLYVPGRNCQIKDIIIDIIGSLIGIYLLCKQRKKLT